MQKCLFVQKCPLEHFRHIPIFIGYFLVPSLKSLTLLESNTLEQGFQKWAKWPPWGHEP